MLSGHGVRGDDSSVPAVLKRAGPVVRPRVVPVFLEGLSDAVAHAFR